MKTKVEGLDAAQAGPVRKRAVAVKLSQLAFEAVAGEGPRNSRRAPLRTQSAVRVYLGDKGTGQPAWPYPKFLRGSEMREEVDLEFDVDPDLWLQFEAEAKRQDVSAQQLLEHAAFYFAAEINAGRITQRILADLEKSEPQDKAS